MMAMPLWVKEKLFTRDAIRRELAGYEGPILFTEHHESHAASAFYPSPFDEAAILTIDGVGEWATSSYGVGRGRDVQLLAELHYPHSLGMLYSAFTYYTGFKVNSGEYKVMGLAPYGEPKYVQAILDELVDLKEDGSFKLNTKYFNYRARPDDDQRGVRPPVRRLGSSTGKHGQPARDGPRSVGPEGDGGNHAPHGSPPPP